MRIKKCQNVYYYYYYYRFYSGKCRKSTSLVDKVGEGTIRLQYLITRYRYKEYLERYLHSCYAPSYQDVEKQTA
jgi:hypothetical protein